MYFRIERVDVQFLSRVSKVNAKLELLESKVHRIKTIHSEILSQPDTNKGISCVYLFISIAGLLLVVDINSRSNTGTK